MQDPKNYVPSYRVLETGEIFECQTINYKNKIICENDNVWYKFSEVQELLPEEFTIDGYRLGIGDKVDGEEIYDYYWMFKGYEIKTVDDKGWTHTYDLLEVKELKINPLKPNKESEYMGMKIIVKDYVPSNEVWVGNDKELVKIIINKPGERPEHHCTNC